MKYLTGEPIRRGDIVLVEKAKTKAIVEMIVDTEDLKRLLDVDEYGVLLQSEPFGKVFWGVSKNSDPIVFVSRG